LKLSDLPQALEELSRQKRLREPDDQLERFRLLRESAGDFIDVASNDYLGLGRSRPDLTLLGSVRVDSVGVHADTGFRPSDVSRATLDPGAAASRLVFGTSPVHLQVEADVADWAGMESALLFSSGYAANVGALGALLSPGDAVFSDALNHASLIDGIRLSGAKATRFPHLDLHALEEGLRTSTAASSRWVVVESYYSMDGDGPDLVALERLCARYDASLYVDEAHGVGIFGPEGAGRCRETGVRPDVLMMGFGKGVGSEGACVLGSRDLRIWLWNRARSFVFSTAPSPERVESLRRQLERTRSAGARRERLSEICDSVREGFQLGGVQLSAGSFGPILSLLVGGEERSLKLCAELKAEGILTQAIRPPTVPVGACRLRIVLHSQLADSHVERLVKVVSRCQQL
jgi:8-amino-7-oxononanoate synthase